MGHFPAKRGKKKSLQGQSGVGVATPAICAGRVAGNKSVRAAKFLFQCPVKLTLGVPPAYAWEYKRMLRNRPRIVSGVKSAELGSA